MGQMFGDMHRDQLVMVREEWERLHQVTQELHTLQLELAKHTPSATPPAPAAPVAPSRNAIQRTGAAAAPSGPAGTAKRPRASTNGKGASAKPAPKEDRSRAPKRAAEAGAPPGQAGQPAASAQNDFHVRLTQRIAALQAERQTLWDKITSFLKPQEPNRS